MVRHLLYEIGLLALEPLQRRIVVAVFSIEARLLRFVLQDLDGRQVGVLQVNVPPRRGLATMLNRKLLLDRQVQHARFAKLLVEHLDTATAGLQVN